MKIGFYDACKELEMHPCEMLVGLSGMVKDMDEVFPEIETVYIETIKKIYGYYEAKKEKEESVDLIKDEIIGNKECYDVIRALHSKDKWGSNDTHIDAIKGWCKDVRDMKGVIKGLIEREYLIQGKGKDNMYSLNPKKKAEIETILGKRA